MIAALMVAGASYWVIHEEPAPPKNRTEVATPPNPGQAAPENPQLAGREKAAPASAAPAIASQAPTTGSSQVVKPPPPPTAAPAPAMPAEDKMSVANRRNVQKALHHRGYYHGPMDGIFGPRTRAAIRRFQDSIGATSTGYLTAVEAGRLVSALNAATPPTEAKRRDGIRTFLMYRR
jgi:peptidoglycan hydrolase-like protein with peptidoglycan-binding domain